MPKISVVLPIYNAEPYLEQCLESIRVQTLKDIEVLCVNDGSKDDSLETILRFAEQDKRFVVLDKPNGGYGHSLNYGIAQAKGEYIAIVEPDDFIDEHMYEDLWGFTCIGGLKPDIVKGSYWEFYDGRDGLADEVREPDVSKCMPHVPVSFTLDQNPELFVHHPCIWSAIYRRAFLEERGIRFIEPKGAGWADNPFLVETLVSAKRIVWVPGNYYYYRQTNAGASSFLKDFHVPFDRMREMRRILAEQGASEDVLAAFYIREFNYIYSVIGEYGFSERDPEIRGLIQETLQSMDSGIVHANPRVRPRDVRYYDRFLGLRLGEHVADAVTTDRSEEASPDGEKPLVTYIAPLKNDASWVLDSLESLVNAQTHPYEVLCADAGSRDASMVVCQRLSQDNSSITCMAGAFEHVPDAVNAGIQAARGTYVFVWNPSYAVDGRFGKAVDALAEAQTDVLAIDQRMRFSVQVMRAQTAYEIDESASTTFPNDVDAFVSVPLSPRSMAPFILQVTHPRIRSLFYRRAFLIERGLQAYEQDEWGSGALGARALMEAETVVYAAMDCFDDLDTEPKVMPFYLEMHEGLIKAPALTAPAALDVAEQAGPKERAIFGDTLRNYVVDAFIEDLQLQPTHGLMQQLCDRCLPRVQAVSGDDFANVGTMESESFNRYQTLVVQGLDAFIAELYEQTEIDLAWSDQELNGLKASPSLRVGRKVGEIVRTVLPEGLAGKLKSVLGGA